VQGYLIARPGPVAALRAHLPAARATA